MFRYMALLWHRENPSASSIANRLTRCMRLLSGWNVVLERDGLVVLAADVSPANRIYTHQHGVVLGTLFHRSPISAVQVSSLERESGQILETGGKCLTRDYWGRYVSFVDDASTKTTWILRDPMGQLPAFHTSFMDVQIYFSYLPDYLQLGIGQLSVNWKYVAEHTVATMIQSRETGLAEVSEILPGECVKQSEHSAERQFFWDPFEIARADPIENRDEGEQLLYEAARGCVRAWAGCYDNILLRLSGGLDSSIVAACLGHPRVPTTITCFHSFTPDGNCDERPYALRAAAQAGLDLVEKCTEHRVGLDAMLLATKCPKPFAYLGPEATDGSELAAQEHAAQAIFTGEAGDQLFYQHSVSLSAVDYFYDRRLWRRGFDVAWDAAVCDAVSVWKVLRQCVRHGLLKERNDPLAGACESMVKPAVIDSVRASDPFEDARCSATHRLAPGKMQHILRLSFANRFYDPMGRPDCAEIVSPLRSQPLVETCLRIPTYVLANGGRDRALARQAFAKDLPRMIMERHAKADVDLLAKRVIHHNLAFVRELLLNGLLVQHGLLDQRKIEAALDPRLSRTASTIGELVHHLATEAWLRSWASASHHPMTSLVSSAAPVVRQVGG